MLNSWVIDVAACHNTIADLVYHDLSAMIGPSWFELHKPTLVKEVKL